MYRVKGADQKEYGPVSADHVLQWIQEGRLNRSSLLQKEGEATWKPLGQFPEFAEAVPVVASAGSTASVMPAAGTVMMADPEGAARRLRVPAVLILILAGLGAVLSVAGMMLKGVIFDWILNGGFPLDPNARTQLEQMRSAGIGPMDIFQAVLGVAINLLVVVGALKMQRLQSWGLSMTSAILVMLPCAGCCCLLGLPVGIWAVLTLNKPEVKAAFR